MGYWQVHLDPNSRDITAFFMPKGRKRWKRMPMGFLNLMGIFCTIMGFVQQKTNHQATKAGLIDDFLITFWGSKEWTNMESILDDAILCSEDVECLFQYLKILFSIYVHYRITINIQKTGSFPESAEFVGYHIKSASDSNRPAASKMKPFSKLLNTPPRTIGDAWSLVGILGFYARHVHNFKLCIQPIQKLIKIIIRDMRWKIDKGDAQKQPKGSFGATIPLSQRWTTDL